MKTTIETSKTKSAPCRNCGKKLFPAPVYYFDQFCWECARQQNEGPLISFTRGLIAIAFCIFTATLSPFALLWSKFINTKSK